MKKKFLVFVITIILLSSFTGCGTNGEVSKVGIDENSHVSQKVEETSIDKANELKIVELTPLYAGGEKIEHPTEELLVDEATQFPETISVYTDPYPSDHSGALYELDDNIKNMMAENLRKFLNCLYQNENSEQYEIEPNNEGSYKAVYIDGKTKIISWETLIRVFTEDYEVLNDAENDNLLDNTLIKAAVEYLNITQPKVTVNHEYDTSGEIYMYSYKITETTDDIIEKMSANSFCYIKVDWFPGNSNVIVDIEKKEVTEESERTLIPYENALNYVQEKFPEASSDQIFAEVYYDKTVDIGHITPCYKFYVEIPDEESNLEDQEIITCEFIYISMADQ